MKPLHPKDKKPPKILVTGANGFIGRALCQNFERNSILHSRLFRPTQKKMLASQKILLQLSFSETCWIYRACERPAEVLILLFIRRDLHMFLTLAEIQVEV